jgi:hypothetical protein
MPSSSLAASRRSGAPANSSASTGGKTVTCRLPSSSVPGCVRASSRPQVVIESASRTTIGIVSRRSGIGATVS